MQDFFYCLLYCQSLKKTRDKKKRKTMLHECLWISHNIVYSIFLFPTLLPQWPQLWKIHPTKMFYEQRPNNLSCGFFPPPPPPELESSLNIILSDSTGLSKITIFTKRAKTVCAVQGHTKIFNNKKCFYRCAVQYQVTLSGGSKNHLKWTQWPYRAASQWN